MDSVKTSVIIEEFKLELDLALRALDHTQVSIEQCSHWLSHLYKDLSAETQVAIVVETWCRYMLRVTIPKKIAFMYLANDLIQKSLLKQTKGTLILPYHTEFSECIE
jgi:CID domain